MNKPLLLFMSAVFLLASCDKKESTLPIEDITIAEEVPKEENNYIINGIDNEKISRFGFTIKELKLVHDKGKQENIELSVSDLPEGMDIIFDPKAGIPGFKTTMRIESSFTNPGTYPVKIHGTSTNGNIKTFKLDVTVKDDFNCDSFLKKNVGIFYTTNDAIKDTIYNKIVFSKTPVVYSFRNLYLETLPNYPYIITANQRAIYFDFDCATQTFTIPEIVYTRYKPGVGSGQPATIVGRYTVSGSGSVDFKKKMATIDYQVITQLNIVFNYKMHARIMFSNP